nr:MAG TPA: hypothetical protein [Caudoviricetes sp.]
MCYHTIPSGTLAESYRIGENKGLTLCWLTNTFSDVKSKLR